ncbi:MAG: hypothetical protein EXS15_04960 [Phycisphaerales bacterium]|nr:hypothetical protein [Phycisphaerales bacterium]
MLTRGIDRHSSRAIALSAIFSASDGVAAFMDNCPAAPNPNQADCDGDGIGDLCEAAIGDLNGDGLVNGADMAILLGNWNPTP